MGWFSTAKSASDELLDKICESLVESPTEWSFATLTSGGGALKHKSHNYIMWEVAIEDVLRYSSQYILYTQVPNTNKDSDLKGVPLTPKQIRRLIKAREEWKATYALRKMLA